MDWTGREGIPQHIRFLVRDRVGILWIASDVALFRFDGQRATRFVATNGQELPASSIASLTVTSDGSIWTGWSDGEISRIHGSTLQNFRLGSGTSQHPVTEVLEGPHRALFALSDGHIFREIAGSWSPLSIGQKEEHRWSTAVFDRHGTLWAGDGGALWYCSGSKWVRATTLQANTVHSIREDHAGHLWVASANDDSQVFAVQEVSVEGHPVSHPRDLWDMPMEAPRAKPQGDPNSKAQIFRESDIAAFNRNSQKSLRSLAVGPDETILIPWTSGVIEIGSDGQVSSKLFPESPSPVAVVDDPSGALWLASDGLLTRQAPSMLHAVSNAELDKDALISATATGSLWLGATQPAPLRLVNRGQEVVNGSKRVFFALHADEQNNTWFADRDGLWRFHAGQFTRERLPKGVTGGFVRQIAGDEDNLYLLAAGVVWRVKGGSWSDINPVSRPVVAIGMLDFNRFWLSFADGTLETYSAASDAGRPESSLVFRGPMVASVAWESGTIFGGASGLEFCSNASCIPIRTNDMTFFEGASGLAATASGDLLVEASQGILQISRRDLHRYFHGDRNPVSFTLLSRHTGPLFESPRARYPTVQQSTQSAWFTTEDGVYALPLSSHIPPRLPPPALIFYASMDGKALASGSVVPSGTHVLHVSYEGVDLHAPETVQYRYRLLGVDKIWQESGHLTEATYSNLRHGSYRFEVQARNESGVWGPPDDSLVFVIAPAIYQRLPVVISVCVVLLVSIYLSFRFRTARLIAKVKLRERHHAEERVRIARELHDTLLQGFQGLMLRFHVAAQSLGKETKPRQMLDDALTRADEVLMEGRNRVNRMRSPLPRGKSLPDALSDLMERTRTESDRLCIFRKSGTAFHLSATVAEELYGIAREAVSNSVRHSQAKTLELSLRYRSSSVELICEDDGIGISSENSIKDGHWGLVGMRERASLIGARLSITSPARGGASISVRWTLDPRGDE